MSLEQTLSQAEKLTRITLTHSEAELARLSLKALDEMCLFLPDTDTTAPATTKAACPLRKDREAVSLCRESLLRNAPHHRNGYILTQRAFFDGGISDGDLSMQKEASPQAFPTFCPTDSPSSAYAPLSLTALSSQLQQGETTSHAIVSKCLQRVEQLNPSLNIFIETFAEEALSLAKQSDARRKAGQALSSLDGLPFALKDNFCYKDHLCECASLMAKGFYAPYTAFAVQQLLNAGMIPLGRVNMDEFAMGSHCEHSRHGATRNPLDDSLSPGGSSGGSAAAVACGMVPAALGSDTGGSVRLPAAWCGVCGTKPAYGGISRWGLVAFSSSLDTVGVFAATPVDCAALLPLLSTADPQDSTQNPALWEDHAPTFREVVQWDLPCDSAIEEALRLTRNKLAQLGLPVHTVPTPNLEASLCAYHVVSSAEAYSNLARFDGLRYGHQIGDGAYAVSRGDGFGSEVKRRLLMGTHVLEQPGLVQRAKAYCEKLCQNMEQCLMGNKLLLSPAAAQLPPPLYFHSQNPAAAYQSDLFLTPASLCGLPSVCFPVRVRESAFPVGICISGNSHSLKALLTLAQRLQCDETLKA